MQLYESLESWRTAPASGGSAIVCAEALAFLRALPARSLDLIVADPPYNLGIRGEAWDRVDNYEAWIGELFRECQRVAKQQVFFFAYNYTRCFENLQAPRERFYWVREGGIRGKRMKIAMEPFYLYASEWARDAAPLAFNTLYERNPYAAKDKRLKAERVFSNVWRVPNLVGKKREKLPHPSQKPIRLISGVVELASNSGDLVLDLFSGSGTTAEACERLGRRWLAVEQSPDYCAMVEQRLRSLDARTGHWRFGDEDD